MADDFRLDPAALSRIVGDSRSAGTALEGAVSALESVLVDHDGCWGSDDLGKAFAKKYESDATKVRGYNQEAASGFDNYAQNAETIGRDFEELDEENASAAYQAYADHDYAEQIKNPPPEQ